jgi:hypothetical protein
METSVWDAPKPNVSASPSSLVTDGNPVPRTTHTNASKLNCDRSTLRFITLVVRVVGRNVTRTTTSPLAGTTPLRGSTSNVGDALSGASSYSNASGALGSRVHTSDDIGVELKGVRGGVERRRGVSGLKARDPGRRDAPGEKVLKERRSPRRRGRMGTSVILERALHRSFTSRTCVVFTPHNPKSITFGNTTSFITG